MRSKREIKKAIAALIEYNRGEERDWQENASYGRGPQNRVTRYDPTLCPGHIYHTIRKLEEYVKGRKSGSKGSLSPFSNI